MPTSGFNLSADDYDINEILQGSHQIRVPDYQREYSWGKDQWAELWDDVYALTRERDNHFLGSIVVINNKSEDIKMLELVDGQQRLTTISILLCVIRDRFEDEEDSEYSDLPELVNSNFLQIKNPTTGETHNKLKLNKFHDDDFKRVLDGNFDLIDDSEIKDAYRYYSNRIEPHDADKVRDIYNELVNSIYLVQIECGSEVSAFRLFESLNDKGLDLGAVDLVKNRVFMEANQNDSIDEERVKALWEDIMTIVRPEINQLYRFFTHYYMSISSPEIKDNVSKNKLYDYVDELLSGELANNGTTLEEMLEDMRTKAEIYVDIKNCEVSENFQRSKLQELNAKLSSTQIKNNRIRTLLLKIVVDYDTADDVLEALNILEVLNTRDKIAGRDSNTSRDRFWSRTCSRMDQHDNPNTYLRRIAERRSPNDTIMKERIVNREFKNNDFTKYILSTIEEKHYMRSGGQEKKVGGRDTVDIEHIAPQRVWGAQKYSEWQKYLDCSEEEFEEYKKRIGNLTLLHDSLNQSASDNPFEQKCNIYRDNTDFLMTQAIAEEFDEWSIEKIKERSDKMAEIVCEVWSMDNV